VDSPAAEVSTAVRDVVDADARALVDSDVRAIVAAVSTSVEAEEYVDAVAEAEPSLTERQRAILDFERQWWKRPGAKEQAIRDNFAVSPTRYYQTLNALLDLPEARTYDGTLVNRLLRLRDSAVRLRRLG
jgi:hypothetical protein